MLWSTIFAFSVGLAPLGLASPLLRRWDDLQVKHAWSEVPNGWTSVGKPSPDQKMVFMLSLCYSGGLLTAFQKVVRMGLKQSKLDTLIGSLYEVSDPTHSRYGQHLSKEEVDALIAPNTDTVDLVDAWLAHHGLDSTAVDRSSAGEWITMVVTVDQAERMLGMHMSSSNLHNLFLTRRQRRQIRGIQPYQVS